MDKIQQFRDIVEGHNLEPKKFSKEIGISYQTYRLVVMPSNERNTPLWVKTFLLGYNLSQTKGFDCDLDSEIFTEMQELSEQKEALCVKTFLVGCELGKEIIEK